MKQTVKTSRAAGQLEKMFRELNKHYFDSTLPEPIISLKRPRPPMVTSPVPRSGRQAAKTSTRSTFPRPPSTVPLRRPLPRCCTRWCTSSVWNATSRTPATTGSITTSGSRNRHRPMVWWSAITTSTAGPSPARPRSCWASSSSRVGKTSRWANAWHGQTWSAPETAARHPAAARPAHRNRPKPRAAPGGGSAPSAAPSSGAPGMCGSSVRTAWSCS